MTPSSWKTVIEQAAVIGIPRLRFVGGEPMAHPAFQSLLRHAIHTRRRTIVETGLAMPIRSELWDLFRHPGVTLVAPYYSDLPEEHDAIVGDTGAYARVRLNVAAAFLKGVRIRVRVLQCHSAQRVDNAAAELRSLGVREITTIRMPHHTSPPADPCGRCADRRALVLSDGSVVGCPSTRTTPLGNILQEPLGHIIGGPRWEKLRADVPHFLPGRHCPAAATHDCPPTDPGTCAPREQRCSPTLNGRG
ncbi:radical SAM/SPASM domain-containing protein [Allostreptomyces psammosilenae]|uniref:MoaA/NifB/PqqE/SkfB family radical SAM enzyme n=1 Tax=Allostreptomyces psammosilenae TaxID=1892865 RepID=A0A853A444_9ACTN|nr:radical SAM/SPASM domain-containing protein [Allostreptomyces psammosilenae]NYI07654.1 MoaA/NifB/PqqE/SkfB family radical SAM enzyme [Allostreptomyces psammosilenae]